jgi:glycine cleavage system H protein
MKAPEHLKYSDQHIWVKVEGHSAKIGMTEFAQRELGEIVFVEMPKVGTSIAKGESFGSVESVKTVSDLYAPVSGKVTRRNEALEAAPGQVNDSPYENGWMIEVELADPEEIQQLWSAQQYMDTYSV